MSSNKLICYENNYFRVQHCGDCFIAGHLVVFPKQDVRSLSELSVQALQELGNVLKISHAIVEKIIQPERIYTLSFGEVLPLIHFHVLPRTSEILKQYKLQNKTEEVNGALIFDWARKYYADKQPENYLQLIAEINHGFKN
jgi:diadenosine tetraphosphate (Ap4A) HIT family hydrolase